jgi:hypothetical protein
MGVNWSKIRKIDKFENLIKLWINSINEIMSLNEELISLGLN